MNSPKGANHAQTPLAVRVKDAAEILSVDEKVIFDALEKAGIDDTDDGVTLLDSSVVAEGDIHCALSVSNAICDLPHLKIKAAVYFKR